MKQATKHQTPLRSFNSPSTFGSTLLKLLQAATITLSLRLRLSGNRKWLPMSPDDSQEFPRSRRNTQEASQVKQVTPFPIPSILHHSIHLLLLNHSQTPRCEH